MKILVAKSLLPFERTEADRFADRLCAKISAGGHDAEVMRFPFDAGRRSGHHAQMLLARALEFWGTDLLLTLDYPSCLMRNGNHVVWLQELPGWLEDTAEFDRMGGFLKRYLSKSRQVFAGNDNVRKRLYNASGIESRLVPVPQGDGDWKSALNALLPRGLGES